MLLLFLLVFPFAARAQEPSTRFERISIEQGLSQVTVYCILQDSKGLMWFGTEDGLNKYEGYTFTVYKRDPEDPHSLSSSAIRSIYEDASGTLWIGTLGGGLNKFDRATERFTSYRHDPDDPHSLGYDFGILSICQGRGRSSACSGTTARVRPYLLKRIQMKQHCKKGGSDA